MKNFAPGTIVLLNDFSWTMWLTSHGIERMETRRYNGLGIFFGPGCDVHRDVQHIKYVVLATNMPGVPVDNREYERYRGTKDEEFFTKQTNDAVLMHIDSGMVVFTKSDFLIRVKSPLEIVLDEIVNQIEQNANTAISEARRVISVVTRIQPRSMYDVLLIFAAMDKAYDVIDFAEADRHWCAVWRKNHAY